MRAIRTLGNLHLSRGQIGRFTQVSHFCDQSHSPTNPIKVENPYTGEIHCQVPTVDFEGAKQVIIHFIMK